VLACLASPARRRKPPSPWRTTSTRRGSNSASSSSPGPAAGVSRAARGPDGGVVAAMTPGPKDRVYISPSSSIRSAYAERSGEIGRLSAGEIVAQAGALKGACGRRRARPDRPLRYPAFHLLSLAPARHGARRVQRRRDEGSATAHEGSAIARRGSATAHQRLITGAPWSRFPGPRLQYGSRAAPSARSGS